ncbi:SR-related and CTD-associated factor 4 [Bombina bombina]|uniref:SR-related and CTD-associated factor 4 n=1 Tax=Bombina bombina TaxID=8345 RepID=UPI00235AECAF|nr:SR-related and CTD-associated factor 4 [Bombina bombina]
MFFLKKLLDRFDYDDEPDAAEDSKKEASSPVHTPPQPTFTYPGEALQATSYVPIPGPVPTMDEFQPMMMAMQQESMQQEAPLPPNGQMLGYGMVPAQSFMPMVPPMISQDSSQPFQNPFQMQQNEMHLQQELQQEIQMEVEQPSNVQENKRPISEQQNAKSRSASRSPKRRRSRSGSRSRRSRHRRSRSRSRDRRRSSPKSRSQERREREKERERRQKGLPPIKPETVSVCSTTLWVGQLDKRTTQQDVSNLLEEFGAIEAINMIPPRGCAYINMVQRQDAYRALQKLSRGTFKVNQKAIKIAWALNKGIKLEYKQYWDVEIGVTYIPWNKVKPEELESFCEGALLDNDTLCPEWKDFPKKTDRKNTSQNGAAEATRTEEITPVTQALPVMSVPIHGPMPAMPVPPHQPMPSLPHPGMSVSQVPSHQGLPLHQAMPAPGLHLPQGVVVPQGIPLPQGMLPLQGMLPPQGLPPGLQPPAFPGPINIPPPGFAPGIPPPPFMRHGFNPMQMPPGFLPPMGIPPPMTPLSIPPPTTGMNIPTSTAGDVPNDSSKEQSQGNPNQGPGSGRENMETDDDDNDEDDGNEFGSAPQERQNSTPGPVNPHHGAPHGGPSHGPPSSSSHGPPTGPQHGPPSGPQHGPPSGPQHGPPPGPQHGPPPGPQHGPPPGPQHGPPSGPQHGPPHGPMHGPPSGPPHGPSHGPPHGPSHGPPHGPPHRPPHGPGMGQAPSTGLLGARPGLIPLQRPPGTPTHMQRFPRPRMMHRGPPPGQGGFGMRGPFPPQGHFPRSRGQGGHGGSEEREERPFRNERQGFNPNREQERFGRRPYGHRDEEEREYFGNRHDERDYERHSSRGRRSWSRGSPEYDHHRDSEERNRWSVGRERERLPSREIERQENKSPDMAEYEEKHHDSFGIENVDPVPELQNEEPKPPGEESVEDTPTKNAAPVEQSENDSVPTEEASS